MINELINMDGYGIYVWSAFIFTLFNFISLYAVIKLQYKREREKFKLKFGTLDSEKASSAKLQSINKEILSNNSII